MDIPLNVSVICQDGEAGHSKAIIINPVTQAVTHFVVQLKGLHHDQYLVPVGLIKASNPESIELDLRREEIVDLAPFKRAAFVGAQDPETTYNILDSMEGVSMAWPYATPSQAGYVSFADAEQVPHDQLAIHKGAKVEATDGRVGTVDEFLINPENSHITHLVLRQGHLWGKREVSIPLDQIDRIDDDVVYLKLDKDAVEQLPDVPVARG